MNRRVTGIKLIDLSSRLDSPEFRDLLRALVGWRVDEEINQQILERTIQAYRYDPQRHMLGVEIDGSLACLIGVEVEGARREVIHHVIVQRAYRGRGLGRATIKRAIEYLTLNELGAETDQDAVEFYRRCGFSVRSLGEKYPGTERFWCVWRSD